MSVTFFQIETLQQDVLSRFLFLSHSKYFLPPFHTQLDGDVSLWKENRFFFFLAFTVLLLSCPSKRKGRNSLLSRNVGKSHFNKQRRLGFKGFIA